MIKAAAQLQVRNRQRHFQPVAFRFDSGTTITAISVRDAEDVGILIPRPSVLLDVQTAAGKIRQKVHPGHLTVRIAGFEGREFRWPCHFVDHPDLPPQPLLGLTGVVEDLRIILEGSYALEAPYGWFILEELSR